MPPRDTALVSHLVLRGSIEERRIELAQRDARRSTQERVITRLSSTVARLHRLAVVAVYDRIGSVTETARELAARQRAREDDRWQHKPTPKWDIWRYRAGDGTIQRVRCQDGRWSYFNRAIRKWCNAEDQFDAAYRLELLVSRDGAQEAEDQQLEREGWVLWDPDSAK